MILNGNFDSFEVTRNRGIRSNPLADAAIQPVHKKSLIFDFFRCPNCARHAPGNPAGMMLVDALLFNRTRPVLLPYPASFYESWQGCRS